MTSGAGREGAIVLAAVLAAGFSFAALAQQGAGLQGARDISGVWWVTKYSPKLEIEGGGDIPYNAKGQALYQKNIAGLKNGTVVDKARRQCVPDGVPRILGNPYPFMIVQTPGQTSIVYELNHVIRIIGMDQKQLSADELEVTPYYSGHSVGHWDGDTLVIETAGFKDTTFLDATGAPNSDAMTSVEHIRKINGGRQLEGRDHRHRPGLSHQAVLGPLRNDPHPDLRLDTYVCGETHRDISHVPGVAEARRAQGL